MGVTVSNGCNELCIAQLEPIQARLKIALYKKRARNHDRNEARKHAQNQACLPVLDILGEALDPIDTATADLPLGNYFLLP
jgi:hypothetical protein